MRLVRLQGIREGMELARDVPAQGTDGVPLLRRGVKLTRRMVATLDGRGVRAVWIEDDLGEGVVPAEPVPEHVRRATEQAVSNCVAAARAIVGNSTPSTRRLDAAIEEIEAAAARLVAALDECPEATLAFDDLATADSYTYTHSVRVATLGLVLGQHIYRREGWIDWQGEHRRDRVAERMTQFGLGLLLHDVGKLAIPAEILNKPGKLTPEEWELIRTHPQAGVSLLSARRLSPLSLCIVRDHHERWDGLGYPRGRPASETHQFARIAAVADVYDAVTADRPYKPATAPHIGVSVIRQGAGTQFDPAIVEHFCRTVMPYPVGYTIVLPNGASAVVTSVDPQQSDRPVARWRADSGQLIERRLHVIDGKVISPIDATAKAA